MIINYIICTQSFAVLVNMIVKLFIVSDRSELYASLKDVTSNWRKTLIELCTCLYRLLLRYAVDADAPLNTPTHSLLMQ
jgi:hypothetical protein